MPETLDDALDAIQAVELAQLSDVDNFTVPTSWYAVVDDDGIVACFANEHDACRFRLAEVNRRLNG